jgi:transcriptional antiterminator NusG
MTDFVGEVLLPTENVQEVKNGQQIVVEKRLWPGYLLIKMQLNDDSWQYVKNTAGVIDFLGSDKPNPLTDREMEEILHDLADKKEKVTHKHKFEVGDVVKITDGVFVNFTGTVTDVYHDKGRLSVMVSIFGRDTRVDDLEFTQVEEAADVDAT